MSNPNNFGAGSGNPPVAPNGPIQPVAGDHPADNQDSEWAQQGTYVQTVQGNPDASDFGQATSPLGPVDPQGPVDEAQRSAQPVREDDTLADERDIRDPELGREQA